jgi:glucosyl-3-phosphoglycerate phosphatase
VAGERTRLVLVRHAESTWNAQARLQGHGGAGLSPLGTRQAAITADHLRRRCPEVRLAVGSDLERVVATAGPWEAVAGTEVRVDVRWREIDVGFWSGLTWAEVERRDPETLAAWQSGTDVRRGGGETFAQLRARAWAAINDLRGVGGTVVVFTHGGPIRVGVAAALELPPLGERFLAAVGNCSLTELVLSDTTTQLGSYNVAEHLHTDGRTAPVTFDA